MESDNTVTPPSSSMTKRLLIYGGMALAYHVMVRPQLQTWGTQSDEASRAMEGDDIIQYPHSTTTYAINIDAPPKLVWWWISQFGRYGLHFYNLTHLSSHEHVYYDIPPMQKGDVMSNSLQTLRIDPQKSVVFGGFRLPNELGGEYDVTLSYTLENKISKITRVIMRSRSYSYGVRGAIYNLVREPVFFGQAMMQLNTLRRLSEETKDVKTRVNGRHPEVV